MNVRILMGLTALILLGCNGPSEPVEDTEPSRSALVASSGGSVPGYTHQLQDSKFRTGKVKRHVTEFGLSKTIGEAGVFAVDVQNGASLGVPNADAPSLARPPLTLDPEVHNQRVMAYFKSAGLPAEQISGVHITASMRGKAHRVDDRPEIANRDRGVLEGFQSVLERSVDGIPVPDSYAWARFNADDEVAWENVHWPPLPAEVLDAAKELRDAVGDPGKKAALLHAVGAGEADTPRVVIRHSSFAVQGPVVAMASLEVLFRPRLGKPRIRHFDINGDEISLPREADVTPPNRK